MRSTGCLKGRGNRRTKFRSFCRRRLGLTLVEVAVSTLLVGLIVVASLRTMQASQRTSAGASHRTRAALLAEDLMAEILQKEYEDPDGAPQFGVEPDEVGSDRTLWDDADDYHLLIDSPPAAADGMLLDSAEWSREVAVEFVDPEDPEVPLPQTDDRGAKRISVRVLHNAELINVLEVVQTRAWISMIPRQGNHDTTGALPPANRAPSAAGTGSPSYGISPMAVNFTAAGSTDPEGQPLTFHWDFGDGSEADGFTVQHTFTNSGTALAEFYVRLTVRDIHGAQSEASVVILVLPEA